MRPTIFDIENWREIGQTLARNKTRTFLTAFGIFWGTAMLAMLWGGAGGLKGMMYRQLDGMSTNLGGLIPERTSLAYKGFPKGMSWSLRDIDVEQIRRGAPQIEYSSTVLASQKKVAYGTKQTFVQVQGFEADIYKINLPKVHHGRVLNDSDLAGMRKVAVVGSKVAEELFGSDTQSAIGRFIDIGGVYFQVIGIVSQKAQNGAIGAKYNDIVVVPSTTMRKLFSPGNSFGYFVFTAKKGSTPSEVKPLIQRVITKNHPIHPDDESAIWFLDVSEMFKQVDGLFIGLNILALFVGLGSLLAGIIGVGNIMWIIVKERTHEIGIRRAIGAKPGDIIVQILCESIVLTMVAGLAGICFATGVLALVDFATADPVSGTAGFQLRFSQAMAVLGAFVVLGAAAGIVPALKSMKIKPIEAINDK